MNLRYYKLYDYIRTLLLFIVFRNSYSSFVPICQISLRRSCVQNVVCLSSKDKNDIHFITEIPHSGQKLIKPTIEKIKEPTFSSNYNNPCKKITYDQLLMNLENTKDIVLSNDFDRAVFILKDNQKFVFYITSNDEKEKINDIITIRQKGVKILVICDKTIFTDSFGLLYCE